MKTEQGNSAVFLSGLLTNVALQNDMEWIIIADKRRLVLSLFDMLLPIIWILDKKNAWNREATIIKRLGTKKARYPKLYQSSSIGCLEVQRAGDFSFWEAFSDTRYEANQRDNTIDELQGWNNVHICCPLNSSIDIFEDRTKKKPGIISDTQKRKAINKSDIFFVR